MLEYQLIRSDRRKTLGLQVKQGRIIVRAPHFVDLTFIEGFVQQKSLWLQQKVIEQCEAISRHCNFIVGSEIYILGQKYSLAIGTAKQSEVYIDHNLFTNGLMSLQVNISERVYSKKTNDADISKVVKKLIEAFFSKQADEVILPRVNHLSNKTSLTPSKINIRQYKARWGSCNSRQEVSLNYLLMMTPLWVIDYVIIHELCHIVHLNHSSKFWALVAQHCSDYNDAKHWLITHRQELYWSAI